MGVLLQPEAEYPGVVEIAVVLKSARGVPRGVIEGLARSGGVLRAEADGLVLEFQTKDGLFGVIKSGVKKVAIPFDRIDEVRLRSNLFRTQLEIRVSSMELTADVPGSEHGTIRLKVPRRYRTEAREMALEASDRVSQCKLDGLERDIEGAE